MILVDFIVFEIRVKIFSVFLTTDLKSSIYFRIINSTQNLNIIDPCK
jgi:hypothetical protein